jgi:hypothetical protein
MAVFVLDKRKQPLMPCSERQARVLLKEGRAVVVRVYPFMIRLKDRIGGAVQPVRVKIDPGSKVTGMAVVRDVDPGDGEAGEAERGAVVLKLLELEHRGAQISEQLTARRAFRHRRRGANLPYRPPRFDNRSRPQGWLPPSLQHRVDTVISWVKRLCRWVPVTGISMELVRFDMQALVNPDIEGVQYQHGTLAGCEVREYLLEKHGHCCAYCDARDVPLNIEHVIPLARGGTDRLSNLVIACVRCNQAKGVLLIEDYLRNDPERLARILGELQTPLKDAAAVNATRQALWRQLSQTGLPVETASGGRTQWNRSRLGIPKTHALDAACVGRVATVERWQAPTLTIKATGRGAYCRTRLTADGFPRGYLMRQKDVHGFRTGDMVRARVPRGRHRGTHVGRVAVRASGSFNIRTARGLVQGIAARHCQLVQRADGYGYQERRFLPGLTTGVSAPGRR